jgi:quercetin dioxygenase-like cupin family protein
VSHVEGKVVVRGQDPLWFLGTLQRLKLDGAHTGGRFALWEGVLPHGAAPPLHSHPQDETFYVLAGEVTAGSSNRRRPKIVPNRRLG